MIKLKQAIIIFIVVLAIILSFILWKGSLDKPKGQAISAKQSSQSSPITQNDSPQIVSTKPDPLEDNIVGATDTIEITFNRPLENVGEFKSNIEPKVGYKVTLSSDRKTAKITAVKGFLLGTTYTLFIGTETKFDGIGRWGEEKIFHFKTITYRGV